MLDSEIQWCSGSSFSEKFQSSFDVNVARGDVVFLEVRTMSITIDERLVALELISGASCSDGPERMLVSSNSVDNHSCGTCGSLATSCCFDIDPVIPFAFDEGRQRYVANRGSFVMFCAAGLALVVRKDVRILLEDTTGADSTGVIFES